MNHHKMEEDQKSFHKVILLINTNPSIYHDQFFLSFLVLNMQHYHKMI